MIPPYGPCPAKIMIISEFFTDTDERENMPLAGWSGQEFNKMLQEAGILRSQCFVTAAIKLRPFGNDPSHFFAERKKDITKDHVLINGKNVTSVAAASLTLLYKEIEQCAPNVIITLGNVGLWAVTGKWGITSWRGSLLTYEKNGKVIKVIPTYSPGAIFRQWSLRQIGVMDLRRVFRHSLSPDYTPPEYDFAIRPTFDCASILLKNLLSESENAPLTLSVDLETRAGHIACIGLAWNKKSAICIPLMCEGKPDGYWALEEETYLIHQLYLLLTSKNVRVIGQNFSYDAQYIHRHWLFNVPVYRDTMLSQHTVFSNLPKSLDFLSSMYAENHIYWKDESKNWDKDVGEAQLWTYNCKDAVITFEVCQAQEATRKEFVAGGWKKLPEIHDFQQNLIPVVLKTMNRGIRTDANLRGQFAMTLMEELAQRESFFIKVLGRPLNAKSPKQIQDLFYTELKQTVCFNRKTRLPSTDDEALSTIAAREPLLKPLVNRILEYRSIGVFLSTFVNAALDTDSRIRCSFNIGGTETFRFSSSKNAFNTGLNLQNIPKGGTSDEGLSLPNVRNLFIPDPGKTFFDIDLSSADLRIVAWECDEKEMKAMLAAGLDPYTEIAKEFYRDPTITKKDPRRQTFKSFAHGTHYLGSAKGLAERLGLSISDAEKTQKWYFSRFPRIKLQQEELKKQVSQRRWIENIFGYRCYFFDRIEGTIYNEAAAWIPQSTVACLINRGYVAVDKTLSASGVEVLLQVHDSLAGQFPTSAKSILIPKIRQCCEIPLPYANDPLTIPVGLVTSEKSWGECG